MDYPRPQISAPFHLHQPRAELRRHIRHARLRQLVTDRAMDCLRLPGHSERRESGRGVLRWFGFDRTTPFGERRRDFLAVTRCPNARAINAPAAAVQVDAV